MINAAVAALEKGMAGGFLQTNAAQPLKKLVLLKESMYKNGREEELALCYGKSADYVCPSEWQDPRDLNG